MIDKKDRILVTGGTGFIGSYIIRTLLKNGFHNLIGLHRASSKFDLLGDAKESVRWVEGDIEDALGVFELLQNVDVVIHAAAVVSFDDSDMEAMIAANRDGTANLVNAALANGIKKFIHISSVAAIGKSLAGNLISEKTEWVESKNNSPYSESKRAAEIEVWRGHAEGLHVSILNPSVVLGAGFWDQTSTKIIANMYRGQKLYPAGGNGFVDVRDVAKAVVTLLNKNLNGRRYIINGSNLMFKDLMNQVSEIYGIPGPKRAIAPWMIPISWRVFKVLSFITRKPTVYARHTVISTSKVWKYDNSKSSKELGIEYIPIKQTLKESCHAYLDSQKNNRNYSKLNIV